MPIRTTISQQKFLDSSEAIEIRKTLENMMLDDAFNTDSTYAAGSDENMSFVDKHMKYLSEHPKLNPQHYVSNIRLMTRKK
ncbi:MAG: hypothetical protein QFB86_00210 [Patescibacteria group bacterium]|nr:hypothetical protein [Patescibacteria group bacterium]